MLSMIIQSTRRVLPTGIPRLFTCLPRVRLRPRTWMTGIVETPRKANAVNTVARVSLPEPWALVSSVRHCTLRLAFTSAFVWSSQYSPSPLNVYRRPETVVTCGSPNTKPTLSYIQLTCYRFHNQYEAKGLYTSLRCQWRISQITWRKVILL